MQILAMGRPLSALASLMGLADASCSSAFTSTLVSEVLRRFAPSTGLGLVAIRRNLVTIGVNR